MTLRDQLKQVIKRELLSRGIGSKYRISNVVTLNSDGTCLTFLDGVGITATPLYPVVSGQEVMLIFGDAGKVSAVPTRPNTPQVDVIHPPFFSGGPIKFRYAAFEFGGSSNSVRIQDSNSNKVYRLILPDTALPGLIILLSLTLSPNGQYLAYTESSNGGSGNTVNFAYRIYKLGATLQSSGAIPGVTNGFFLNASLVSEFLVQGYALASALYSGDEATYNSFPTRPALYLTNDPFLYAVENLAEFSFGNKPAGTTIEIQQQNFISFASGSRVVLGTTIVSKKTSTGGSGYSDSGTGINSLSILAPMAVSAFNTFDVFSIPARQAGYGFGSFGPLTYSAASPFQIEPSSSDSFITPPSFPIVGKKSIYTYEDNNLTFVRFFSVNPSDGSFTKYSFIGDPTVSFPLGGSTIQSSLFGDGTSNGSLLFICTSFSPYQISVYSVTIDNVAKTVSIGNLITVTPDPPDSGYTQNQLRTGTLNGVSVRTVFSISNR